MRFTRRQPGVVVGAFGGQTVHAKEGLLEGLVAVEGGQDLGDHVVLHVAVDLDHLHVPDSADLGRGFS